MKFIKFIYSRQISQQFGMPLYITVFSSHRVYTKTGLYSSQHRAISFFNVTRFSNRLTHRLTVTVATAGFRPEWPLASQQASIVLQAAALAGDNINSRLPGELLNSWTPAASAPLRNAARRRRCPDVPCPVKPGGRPLNTEGCGHMGAATNSLET